MQVAEDPPVTDLATSSRKGTEGTMRVTMRHHADECPPVPETPAATIRHVVSCVVMSPDSASQEANDTAHGAIRKNNLIMFARACF